MTTTAPGRVHEVAVVGDGPAGSALAAALAARGADVVLVGDDRPWTATYGAWIDEVEAGIGPDAAVWGARDLAVTVRFDRTRCLARPYGVLDNTALALVLRAGLDHRRSRVDEVRPGALRHRVSPADGGSIHARVVVDATGWPRRLGRRDDLSTRSADRIAWQTAFGVVLPDPPAGTGPMAVPTLMDFSEPAGASALAAPTFGYALPVHDGWLVEETVLAARPAIDPELLAPRLAARLGRPLDDLLAEASRTETVRIPMGVPPPRPDERIAAYGASAGMLHPATGYSVGASLAAAPAVADGIVELLVSSPGAVPGPVVGSVVWSAARRRTRALQDFGLAVLLRLDGAGIRVFFDSFFDLPEPDWRTYLDTGSPPGAVAGVMTRLFRSAPWELRRRLVAADPRPLRGLLWP